MNIHDECTYGIFLRKYQKKILQKPKFIEMLCISAIK